MVSKARCRPCSSHRAGTRHPAPPSAAAQRGQSTRVPGPPARSRLSARACSKSQSGIGHRSTSAATASPARSGPGRARRAASPSTSRVWVPSRAGRGSGRASRAPPLSGRAGAVAEAVRPRTVPAVRPPGRNRGWSPRWRRPRTWPPPAPAPARSIRPARPAAASPRRPWPRQTSILPRSCWARARCSSQRTPGPPRRAARARDRPGPPGGRPDPRRSAGSPRSGAGVSRAARSSAPEPAAYARRATAGRRPAPGLPPPPVGRSRPPPGATPFGRPHIRAPPRGRRGRSPVRRPASWYTRPRTKGWVKFSRRAPSRTRPPASGSRDAPRRCPPRQAAAITGRSVPVYGAAISRARRAGCPERRPGRRTALELASRGERDGKGSATGALAGGQRRGQLHQGQWVSRRGLHIAAATDGASPGAR